MQHETTRAQDRSAVRGLCAVTILSEAKTYHAYARECLKLAEVADQPDIREKLIELSRAWMEAALTEEKHHLEEIASRSPEKSSRSI